MMLEWIKTVKSLLAAFILATPQQIPNYVNLFWLAFEDCHIAPDSEVLEKLDLNHFTPEKIASNEIEDFKDVWKKIMSAPLTRLSRAPQTPELQRWRKPLMMNYQQNVDQLYYEKMHSNLLLRQMTDTWDFNQWTREVGLQSYLQARNLIMTYSDLYLKQRTVSSEITDYLIETWHHQYPKEDRSYDNWFEWCGYKEVQPKYYPSALPPSSSYFSI